MVRRPSLEGAAELLTFAAIVQVNMLLINSHEIVALGKLSWIHLHYGVWFSLSGACKYMSIQPVPFETFCDRPP